MKRGTFIAALAGPARVPVLVLTAPMRMRTMILKEGPGELTKLLARVSTRPLQLLWADRTPACTVFATPKREMGAVIPALKRTAPRDKRGAG